MEGASMEVASTMVASMEVASIMVASMEEASIMVTSMGMWPQRKELNDGGLHESGLCEGGLH